MTTEKLPVVQVEPAPPDVTPLPNQLPQPPKNPSIKPNPTTLGVAKLIADVAISFGIFGLIWAGKVQVEIGLVFIAALLGLSVANLVKGNGSGVGPTGGLMAIVGAGFAAIAHRTIDVTRLSMALLLVSWPVYQYNCSSSAQQTQARVLDTVARISNATITQLEQEYRRQQLDVADEACGHATPCADPEEAAAAVRVIRDQWRPVWSALALLRTSHDVYASQVEACRLADVCTVDFVRMGTDILRHQSELRCALRAIRVTDPFPGTVSCPGLDAGVVSDE